jgi:hypothetical protein
MSGRSWFPRLTGVNGGHGERREILSVIPVASGSRLRAQRGQQPQTSVGHAKTPPPDRPATRVSRAAGRDWSSQKLADWSLISAFNFPNFSFQLDFRFPFFCPTFFCLEKPAFQLSQLQLLLYCRRGNKLLNVQM